MKMTLPAERKRCHVPMLALTLAAALFSALAHPQTAEAQRIGRKRPRPAPRYPAPNIPPTPTPPLGNRGVVVPPNITSGPVSPLPGVQAYSPSYYSTYTAGVTVPSLYGYYAGAILPYMSAPNIANQPPQFAYVPVPVYNSEGAYQGDANAGQNADMSVADATTQNPLLGSTIVDIETAWNQKNIGALSNHVRPGELVAVYLSGTYSYSLDGGDYLSVTRSALTAINTSAFTLDKVQAMPQGVYTVSGQHTYIDKAGNSHTVVVTYVLQKTAGQYDIIEVDTAPAKLPASGASGGQSHLPTNPAARTYRSVAHAGVHAYPYDASAPQYPLTGSEWDAYFPSHLAYYPHYALHYRSGATVHSPFYYYNGAFAPYIGAVSSFAQQPRTAYVSMPLYTAQGQYRGDYGDDNERNGKMNVADATAHNPLLAKTISDIQTAWSQQDARSLSKHVQRDSPVAVYRSGRYSYSMDGRDYVSIARDAITSGKAVGLTLDKVQQMPQDIYTVSGRHIYIDTEGKSHTVLVSYVLEKVDDDYYLSQVGTTLEQQEH